MAPMSIRANIVSTTPIRSISSLRIPSITDWAKPGRRRERSRSAGRQQSGRAIDGGGGATSQPAPRELLCWSDPDGGGDIDRQIRELLGADIGRPVAYVGDKARVQLRQFIVYGTPKLEVSIVEEETGGI